MEQEIKRVRIPKEDEMFGRVVALLGANRLQVECEDGKERVCRIPGKLKKRVWTRIDDIVIIKPWSFQSEKKADLVWRYAKNEVEFLKKKSYLKNL